MKRATAQPHVGKIRTWTTPTVLSLILGAVGLVALIELRPQISVSPQEQLKKGEPFSAPFRITNTSYYSLRVIRPTCYIHRAEFGGSDALSFDTSTVNNSGWEGGILERGESQTIDCEFMKAPLPLTKCDMVIVVDYDAAFWPEDRRYFRFVGVSADNWQWLPQPSTPIQANADKSINEMIKSRRR